MVLGMAAFGDTLNLTRSATLTKVLGSGARTE